MERWTGAALAVMSVFWLNASLAQTAPTPVVPNLDNQEFVTQAARATMLDIAAATRVEQKIQDPSYKAYALQVLGDDSKMEADLKSMAQGAGLTIPDGLDQARELVLKDLRSSDGAQLEQKFRSSQIGGIHQSIEIFHNFGRSGRDAKLKSWAQSVWPTLQNHLEAVTRLPLIPSESKS